MSEPDTVATDLPAIVQAGHPVLRAAAEPVDAREIGTRDFRRLVDAMIAVMRAAPGVGLAAPQIGVPRQIVVVEDKKELIERMDPQVRATRLRDPLPLTVIVNPVLRVVGDAHATFLEGCLSVRGFAALVRRALEVEVTGIDATGREATARVWRLKGWPARILQHEVDHVRGTLYVDRMYTRSFTGPEDAGRWAGRPTEEVAAELGVDLGSVPRP